MPKGPKKRAKLKKKQQQGHPDDGGNTAHHNGNGNGSGSDNNATAPSRRDADHGHHLRISPKASHVDASEDSMESSEEMVTPRATGSEADEEERKAAAVEVPVERAVEVVQEGGGAAAGDAGEESMVDALPPETGGQAHQEAEVEVHAVASQEQEVKDVVVAEAPVVEVPEVKREAAKVHPVPEQELKVDEVVVVHPVPEPESKGDSVAVAETVSARLVQEPEKMGGNVVVKNSAEVSRSREVDVHTTEVARGSAVAVAASGQWATWWNCCGLFDAFSGSER